MLNVFDGRIGSEVIRGFTFSLDVLTVAILVESRVGVEGLELEPSVSGSFPQDQR